MVRLKRVSASREMEVGRDIKFSADDVLQLLFSIEELKMCNIALVSSADNKAEFVIGEYAYSIPTA